MLQRVVQLLEAWAAVKSSNYWNSMEVLAGKILELNGFFDCQRLGI